MDLLTYDRDINQDVLEAIQTILNIFSTDRKQLYAVQRERDDLLTRLKMLENARSLSVGMDRTVPREDISRRKRMKTEASILEKSPSITTNQERNDDSRDELNNAFRSTISDDDIIEPTQCEANHSRANKLLKSLQGQRNQYLIHQNKENERYELNEKDPDLIRVEEKSPTVLGKRFTRIDLKHTEQTPQVPHENVVLRQSKNENTKTESPNSRLSNKPVTPRRLFDNWSTHIDESMQQQEINKNLRKKLTSTMKLHPSRLKQSTIKFPKCDEETFCESISVVEHDMESPRNLKIKTEKSGSMLNKQLKMSNSYVPTPLELRKVSTNDDSVIALENETNEVINVEESQPTQALYQYVLDIKQELPENESQDFVEESPLQKKSPSSSHNVVTMPRTVECEDCAKYHNMLGRDLDKNPPKKYGVCSKHHRNVQLCATPPGFWNPKIVDSDSDHEETPFDHRFAKN